MDINISRTVFNDVYLDYLFDKNRYLVLYGGAGSGKSFFAAQKIIFRTLSERNHRFLVIRKVRRTIRLSVFQLFRDIIEMWGLSKLFFVNKSDYTITCVNGNTIHFSGIDDPEKIKSITNITGIWIEEATELRRHDFEELNRRLRGKLANYKQIIISFNPILSSLWVADMVKNKENTAVVKTTYKDNRFIDEEYKKILESYTGNARRVYTEGEFGQLENLVFTNWDIIPEFPETDKYVYGVDFGFSNPKAVVKVFTNEKDMYIQEILYKRQLKTADMVNMLDDRSVIYYCDPSDPEAIAIMRDAGFMVMTPNKSSGSRISSINSLLDYNIHIVDGSTNVIKEFQLCQRQVDKNGNIMEDIVKENDHAIDAVRYTILKPRVGAVGVL